MAYKEVDPSLHDLYMRFDCILAASLCPHLDNF